jgi:hypothetical protein
MLMTSGLLHGYLPVSWVVGSLLGVGPLVYHLNLFVIFVAESGTTRKSTAVRVASKFARSFSGTDVAFIESRITPEKLEFDLAMQSAEYGHAYATIAIDELVKFLRTREICQRDANTPY